MTGELDRYADDLRAALTAEVSQVEPEDRFDWIWAEARFGPRRQSRKWPVYALILVFFLGAVVIIPGLIASRNGGDTRPAATAPTSQTQASSSTLDGPASLSTIQRGLPVFYVGSDGLLYRELRDLPTQGSRLATAVAAVLNVAPTDPDYVSHWSPATVLSVERTTDTLVIDLSETAFENWRDESQARLAIRQLIYTAATALGEADGDLGVIVLAEGSTELPVLGRVQQPWKLTGDSELGLVWFDTPGNGEKVSDTVEVAGQMQGVATKPMLRITNLKTTKVVRDGAISVELNPNGWKRFSMRFGLSAGKYQIQLSVLDASGKRKTQQRIVTVGQP